jgi:hypothetical protein
LMRRCPGCIRFHSRKEDGRQEHPRQAECGERECDADKLLFIQSRPLVSMESVWPFRIGDKRMLYLTINTTLNLTV